MGLYRIPIRPEKIKAVPHLMKSIGFPVVRTESKDNGTCYACANPKRSNKNWTFWIKQEEPGGPRYFLCGLSQTLEADCQCADAGGTFRSRNSRRSRRRHAALPDAARTLGHDLMVKRES